jgi:hypothetical protein
MEKLYDNLNHCLPIKESHMRKRIFIFQLVVLAGFLSLGKIAAQHEDRIITLHIPKTGGMSLHYMLENEYDFSQVNTKNGMLYLAQDHWGLLDIEQRFNLSHFKLITFLRDPVERVLSEHRFILYKCKTKKSRVGHRLPLKGDPIDTASNVACLMLSGLDEKDPLIPIETHLMHAKKALAEKFYFIGITERMEESIHLLYSRLGWELPEEIPSFNETNYKEEWSEEILQGIAERNWADIELYEYALHLYQFQKEQISSQISAPPTQEVSFVQNSHYTFNKRLQGYGWGPRIHDKKLKRFYRWVLEKSEVGIDFYLQPDASYRFECTFLLQPLFAQQLSVLVNGFPINLKFETNTQSLEYTWVKAVGIIPQKCLKQGKKTSIVMKMNPPKDAALHQLYLKNSPRPSYYKKGKFACSEIIITKQN